MTITDRYISVTDTAKLVRIALAKHFPGVTFSVRSSKYAGGASINVSWTDGPRAKRVDHLIKGFEGRSFDGMNDLATSQDSWLLPDGTADLAYRPDSCGGSIPEYVSDAPHPNAKIVHFGANYVFSNRHISDYDRKLNVVLTLIKTRCALENNGTQFGNRWIEDLARNTVYDQDAAETLEQAFSRVVLKNGEEI